MTTVLIMIGTFVGGWFPVAMVFTASCRTCRFVQEFTARPELQFVVGVLTNALVIVKYLANPLIYSLRIPEVKKAMCTLIGWRPRRNVGCRSSTGCPVQSIPVSERIQESI